MRSGQQNNLLMACNWTVMDFQLAIWLVFVGLGVQCILYVRTYVSTNRSMDRCGSPLVRMMAWSIPNVPVSYLFGHSPWLWWPLTDSIDCTHICHHHLAHLSDACPWAFGSSVVRVVVVDDAHTVCIHFPFASSNLLRPSLMFVLGTVPKAFRWVTKCSRNARGMILSSYRVT